MTKEVGGPVPKIMEWQSKEGCKNGEESVRRALQSSPDELWLCSETVKPREKSLTEYMLETHTEENGRWRREKKNE